MDNLHIDSFRQELEKIPGWFDFEVLYTAMADSAKMRTTQLTFVEVGCWLGKSTAFMAFQIKLKKLPIDFYGIDTWEGSPTEAEHQETAKKIDLFKTCVENLTQCGVLDHVYLMREASLKAATFFKDNSCDFVFIDADHTHASVSADLRAWFPKVARGGILAGHDNRWGQVHLAVTQFCAEQRLSFEPFGSCWQITKI